jgi:hypothetical protein
VSTDPNVMFYDGAANNYDLTLDPRCLWGWGPPSCNCPFGHGCFREFGHAGRCWDGGDKPTKDDPKCWSAQRPKDWDATGRAEANR